MAFVLQPLVPLDGSTLNWLYKEITSKSITIRLCKAGADRVGMDLMLMVLVTQLLAAISQMNLNFLAASSWTNLPCGTASSRKQKSLKSMTLVFNSFLDTETKQKCITVGCVPPARWPYPVVSDGGGSTHPPLYADPLGRPLLMQTPT